MSSMDAWNIYINWTVNKYLHTVASCWNSSTLVRNVLHSPLLSKQLYTITYRSRVMSQAVSRRFLTTKAALGPRPFGVKFVAERSGFQNTVKLHLSGLVWTVNHPDMQKIRIVEFFLNRLSCQLLFTAQVAQVTVCSQINTKHIRVNTVWAERRVVEC